MTPRVKPLEWRGPFEAFPSTMWEAETPFGRYEIEEQNASDSPIYELRFNMKVVAIKDGVPELQECAQADFNQRILSSLEPASSVEGEEPVAWPGRKFCEIAERNISELAKFIKGEDDRQVVTDAGLAIRTLLASIDRRPSPAVSAEVTK